MTDGEAVFQPGAEETRIPFRARGAYAGYRAFGSGDGAVLVEPDVAPTIGIVSRDTELRPPAVNALLERAGDLALI